MEESLKNLFSDTVGLIKRYGICLLKEPIVNVKELKDLSSCLMYICDESLKQDVTFKRVKNFKQEIFPYLYDTENVEEDAAIFQFQNELQQTYAKLDLGRKNVAFKEFEDDVLSKIPKKNVENDVTAVSQNVNVLDPITKLRLTDPVKNSICGHVYEKAVIMHLLNTNKISKCPIPGCVAADNFTKKDLLPDIALKKYLDENT